MQYTKFRPSKSELPCLWEDQVKVPIWFKKDANPKYACYCSKVTEEQVIDAVIKQGAKSVKEVNAITGAMKNSNCEENNPSLILDGKIRMTLPDKPKSKFQKYYS